MCNAQKTVLLLFFLITLNLGLPGLSGDNGKKDIFRWNVDDHALTIKNRLKIDASYGKNTRMLNSCNDGMDEILIAGRHTWDLELLYGYGKKTYSDEVVKLKTGFRNRSTWGDTESIARTGVRSIKDGEVVLAPHHHPITVNIPIIRELWMEYCLKRANDLCATNKHTLTLGLFPFQLGRGISLGTAYDSVPEFIGYNVEDAVQQYAPGAKFSGIISPSLKYDLYLAIRRNKSDTFDNVNERIRGHEYGHLHDQARRYGVFNYVVAARTPFELSHSDKAKISIEPYIMHNVDDEMRIELPADATWSLTTYGLALEAQAGPWELGFEMAFNGGSQRIKGIDRNRIEKNTGQDGLISVVNSKVSDITVPVVKKAVYNTANQARINAVLQSVNQNSKIIPKNDPAEPNLINSVDRFRDPYQNIFKGSMSLFDISCALSPCIKVAGTFGFATGDENPNVDLDDIGDSDVDGDYRGFISLQETYSGKRVRSAFLMAGTGAKIPRISSVPGPTVRNSSFTPSTAQFTNLGFAGGALWIKTKFSDRDVSINPNVLSYWQTFNSRTFNICNGTLDEAHLANPHLGVETNVYVDVTLPYELKLSLVAGFFVPGKHFDDIKGIPLSKDQQRYLDRRDSTGVTVDTVPVVGNSTAYFWTLGLEYAF